MEKTAERVYNVISVICGSWFMLTSCIWIYLINLFISFPVGLVGIYFWSKGRKASPVSTLNKIAIALHGIGLVASLVTLVAFLLTN